MKSKILILILLIISLGFGQARAGSYYVPEIQGLDNTISPTQETAIANFLAGSVNSFKTRTGEVVPATGDYSCGMITSFPAFAGNAGKYLCARSNTAVWSAAPAGGGGGGTWGSITGTLPAQTDLQAVLDGKVFSASGIKTRTFGIIIDEGGSVITTSVKGFVVIPYACTITGWTVLSVDSAVTSGSIEVRMWKDSYANYPPTVADIITSNTHPNISGHKKGQGTTLTGWTTSVSAGDIIGFYVNSVAILTKVYLIIEATL